MRTRRWIEEGLRRASRSAKRWLGVQNPGLADVPPPPFYLLEECAQPGFSDRCESRTFVFLLQHASRGSGGLADILHLGVELEKTGLRVFYCPVGGGDVTKITENILWTNDGVRREQVVSALPFVPEYVCATAWPTAYKALAQPSHRKLYFVQDYEPWFHSAGVARWYASRTYELGLEMFTLGPWLAEHLQAMHGDVRVIAMPFPASDMPDAGRPLRERKYVSFYVQPDKEHRGTELLLEGARRVSSYLAEHHPEMQVVLFGSTANEYAKSDFRCRTYGVLSEKELAALMRETRIGICASFTNVSLLTLRFLAHGGVALDLDLPNVWKNLPAATLPLTSLFRPDARSLLSAVVDVLNSAIDEGRRVGAVGSLAARQWPVCFEAIAPLIVGARSR